MEAIAAKVLGLLGSLASKELDIVCNFQEDLQSMKSMISAIKAVLRDAEAKAVKSQSINDWLEKLKDVLLDAEDLLDAYYADELARKVMTTDNMAIEVLIFFSKLNPIACALVMGHKMKAVRKMLDGIARERNMFQLNESSANNEGRQTHSVLREDIVGRETEKKSLVRIILDPDVENNISVVPIVGIGGLGKTTLAQQVYNEKDVKRHFELMKWVCVSDESGEFNIKRVVQKIIGEEKRGEMEEVAQELRKMIKGKLFLLVLDDVWNEDRERWLELENLLRGGKKGSMIIVTTRGENVAQIMGTLEPIRLHDLDFESSWELFCRLAFRDGKEPNNQELVGIGRDIVRKCAGVPLAIRTIGSLLFTKKLGVSEWSYFRDTDLASIDSHDQNKIYSILKLSYDHLPSHLKNCFAFCSLFPKDYVIERTTLVQLWMAEGFIQSLDKHRCMEDVGDEYFEELLSRCLFQDVELDAYGEIESCKMHDLIHDLAQSLTKNECYIVTSSEMEENFNDRIRHVSCHLDNYWEFPNDDDKTNRVRTIISHVWCKGISSNSLLPNFFYSTCGSTISFPKYLRVLCLTNQEGDEIPRSIGELKHLRYLDLSHNNLLEKLPQAITKLHNLQTLKLNYCGSLKELPSDIKKMVSLRHFELVGCDQLEYMPHGLGCLTNLQTLTTFVVAKKRCGTRISELQNLKGLRILWIGNLERQRYNIKEVEHVKLLNDMPSLRELQLMWSLDEEIKDEYREEEIHDKDAIILKSLEPPHTIKNLSIDGYCGKRLPNWIVSLSSLQQLALRDCFALASLLDSIGSLALLQGLSIENYSTLVSLPDSIGSLTSLQKLSISYCSALASLPDSIGSLTSLQELSISYCSALASLDSIGSLTSLQRLSIYDCSALASLPNSIESLTSLQKLLICNCSALASFPNLMNLRSLQELSIYNTLP